MKTYQKPSNYVELQYKRNSAHMDGSLENESDFKGAETAFHRLTNFVDLYPKAVLVLGCRTGYESQAALWFFGEETLVIGMDIVPEFVKHACKRVPTMVGDMHDLDLPDDFFDLVMCRGSLEHCYNPKLAVEEMYRVCKHHAYITVDLEKDRKSFPSHFAFSEDPEEWLDIFRDCGFQILETGFDKGMYHEGLWVILEK